MGDYRKDCWKDYRKDCREGCRKDYQKDFRKDCRKNIHRRRDQIIIIPRNNKFVKSKDVWRKARKTPILKTERRTQSRTVVGTKNHVDDVVRRERQTDRETQIIEIDIG